jgi:thioredoxin 1
MIELTDETFEKEISTGTVLVDCYATWCGVCKMIKPRLEEIKNIKVCAVDMDKCTKTAQELGITNLPTLILYKDGKELDRGSFDLLNKLEDK